jgi:hypothetical protein
VVLKIAGRDVVLIREREPEPQVLRVADRVDRAVNRGDAVTLIVAQLIHALAGADLDALASA